jgi:hypothetical protein
LPSAPARGAADPRTTQCGGWVFEPESWVALSGASPACPEASAAHASAPGGVAVDPWLLMLTSDRATTSQAQTNGTVYRINVNSQPTFAARELVKFLSSIRRDVMLRFAFEGKQE